MTYNEEQNKVFQFIFDQIYLKRINSYEDNPILNTVELIITPECNLACEYCYLYRYGDQLYPKEIRNHKTILSNNKKLFEYFKENNLKIKTLSLFSGEIWGTDFGVTFLTELLEYYKDYKFSNEISIPSNMSFLLNDEKTKQIENLMEEFKKLGVHFWWSASVEGKIIEDKFRPFKNNDKHTDDFYHRVFTFAQKHGMGFHPMVYSKSCKYWIENYKWFKEKIKEYNLPDRDPMMLEVRNDNWTDEDIDYYLEFIDFLIDEKEKEFDNIRLFSKHIMQYVVGRVYFSPLDLRIREKRLSCNIQMSIHIRLGDLAIVPCHRLAYKQFIYGFFECDEQGKISGVKMENSPEFLLYITTMNPSVNLPQCDKCVYKEFCSKGCLGAQYESHKDLTLTCPSVCNFYKRKINFLIDKYEKNGVLAQMEKDSSAHPQLFAVLNQIKLIKEWRASHG